MSGQGAKTIDQYGTGIVVHDDNRDWWSYRVNRHLEKQFSKRTVEFFNAVIRPDPRVDIIS